jgi:hypothetical protein
MSEETEESQIGRIGATTMHSEAWWVRLMDGALTPEEQEAWEAHVGRCTHCRQEWEMLTAVDLVLAVPPALPELSPDFTVNTVKRVLQRQQLRKLLSTIVGLLIVAGVTVLIFRYLGAAYTALEWAISAVLSARQMLFRSLVHTLVALILSWKAVLPFIGGIGLLFCLIAVPNGMLVTVTLLWLSRRRRRDIGSMGEVGYA